LIEANALPLSQTANQPGALEMVSVGPEKNKLILYRILPIAIKAVDNFELFG